jgi:hypothetical protein
MRDLIVFAFLCGSIGLAFWRPWLGVLALAVFNHMAPHRFTWGFMLDFPVYQVLFVAVFAAMLTRWRERQPLPRDWRIPTFFFLWFWFLLTTLDAEVSRFACMQLEKVSKIYLPFILMLWLIDSRQKLYWLIVTTAVSIGFIAVKGGIRIGCIWLQALPNDQTGLAMCIDPLPDPFDICSQQYISGNLLPDKMKGIFIKPHVLPTALNGITIVAVIVFDGSG